MQCLSLVIVHFAFIFNHAQKLRIIGCEIKLFKFFSFWHRALLLVHTRLRPGLVEHIFEDSCHLHGFDNFGILQLFPLLHMFDSLVDLVAH